MEPRPYLTEQHPGTGGQIKAAPEDFVVEEIPLYEPSGEGQHVYVRIEKRSLSTYQAIKAIARRLGVPAGAIGYAGLKDARAVTRQTLSIDGIEPEQAAALQVPGVQVLEARRHRNKLKIGHLAGNRFRICVRGPDEGARPAAHAVLGELQARGVPNYFGGQRFGVRGNTHRLGLALLRGDAEAFLGEYLGRPEPAERPEVQAARAAADAGDYAAALAGWPASLREERFVLSAVVRRGGDPRQAFRALDKRLARLFVSAYQSYLFNRLLAERIPHIDRLEAGDVAFIHASGAAFLVQDPSAEQPRAERFEISPSGPLFGPKTLLAQGRPGEREQAVLRESGLSLEEFRVPGVKLRGARRPYRIPLTEVEVGWDQGLLLGFRLPPGGYATEVLREVMKVESVDALEEEED